jgi:CheY-like chemotaxis protein
MNPLKVILLIDDDEDDRDLFREAIANVNPSFSVITKNGAEEAISYLEETERIPDCIFLDLNLPVISGKACLTMLKSNSRLSDIPVAIYSTSSHEKDIEETTKLGASLFVQKPGLFSEICTTLKTAINHLDRIKKSYHSA